MKLTMLASMRTLKVGEQLQQQQKHPHTKRHRRNKVKYSPRTKEEWTMHPAIRSTLGISTTASTSLSFMRSPSLQSETFDMSVSIKPEHFTK